LLEKVGTTYQAAQSSYKANEIGGKSFWLHGHAASGALRDYAIKAEHSVNGCEDVAKYTVAKVEFNMNPVVIGVGENRTSETPAYPETNPATHPYRVMATITPKDVAGSVTFGTDIPERATVSEVSRSDAGGSQNVILKASGASMTPASAPGGDARIIARFGSVEIASAQVIVIIPAAIHRPCPQYEGVVEGINLVTDSTTSPSTHGLPPGYVRVLLGYYHTVLTITVDDQFGNVLHPIYAGAQVTESGGLPINQVISPSGTYSDPVGVINTIIDVIAENPPGTPNPVIATLLSMPIDPVVSASLSGSITIEVDGHTLGPGIENRKITATAPNQLMIEWLAN